MYYFSFIHSYIYIIDVYICTCVCVYVYYLSSIVPTDLDIVYADTKNSLVVIPNMERNEMVFLKEKTMAFNYSIIT